MNTNDYFKNSYKKWLSFVVSCCLILTLSILFVNIFSLIINFVQNKSLTLNVIFKVLILNLCNFILSLIALSNLKEENLEKSKKIICINYFLISFLPSIFYTNYSILLVLPCISIIFAAVFENLKTMKIFYFLNILLILNYFINNISKDSIELIGVIIAIIILNIIFKVSKEIYFMIQEDSFYIKKIIKKNNNLQKKLDIEPLTKLLNKNSLIRDLEIIKKQNNKISPCIVMIDLDFFKRINDTFGHVNGDKALLSITNYLNKLESNNVKAYRFGGEEFVILFKNTDIKNVYNIIEKTRKNFGNVKHDYINNEKITFSAGISTYDGKSSIYKWLDQADKALYQAKNEGRNKVIIYKE